MNKEEFRNHLMKVKELSDEIDSHMKKLLDAVEIDRRFIEHLPNYQTKEGELIPKMGSEICYLPMGRKQEFQYEYSSSLSRNGEIIMSIRFIIRKSL